MARRIFAASSVTSTGSPQVLRFYARETGGRPEGDLYLADEDNYPSTPLPSGMLLTAVDGSYPAFAGPEDMLELWREVGGSGSRTKISAGIASVPGAVTTVEDAAADVASLRTLGTGEVQAAAGDHAHTGLSVQDAGTPSVRALGTTATTAAAGNHTHDGLSVQDAGTASVRAIGTGATDAAAGNHSHPIDPAVDQAGFRTLGTGATQAAPGDHTHSPVATVQRKIKTSATSVTSSTSLADDAVLKNFPVEANATYLVDLDVEFQDNNVGFKYAFTGPAASTMNLKHVIIPAKASPTVSTGRQTPYTLGAALAITGDASVPVWLRVSAVISTTNSGNITWRWAPNSSSATAVNVLAGSNMTVAKLL